jgi:hypothetical protein
MPFSKEGFKDCLNELGLTVKEAAKLLHVTPHTVTNWFSLPHRMPGPVTEALRAWQKLKRCGLPWRPDGFNLTLDCYEYSASPTDKDTRFILEIVNKVRDKIDARDTTIYPWQINMGKGIAQLETISVSFRLLPSSFPYKRVGDLYVDFVPLSYWRDDKPLELAIDRPIFDNAIFAIYEQLKTGRKWG